MAGEGRARQQLHEREIQRAQRSSAHSGFARQLRRIERAGGGIISAEVGGINGDHANRARDAKPDDAPVVAALRAAPPAGFPPVQDRKSTRLNSSHTVISYAVFCLKKKNKT